MICTTDARPMHDLRNGVADSGRAAAVCSDHIVAEAGGALEAQFGFAWVLP